MGTLAPSTPLTEQQVRDKLHLWREHLIEAKTGRTNCILTLPAIRKELDRLLDELTIHLATKTLA